MVQSPEQLRVHVRWMIRRDMTEVLMIEELGFEFPWSESDFVGVLRQRNNIGMIAEHNEQVVGFMVYSLHETSLHIVNFAVHPSFRMRGVGRQLVAKLVSKLNPHRRVRMMLEVRESNLDAQLFFKACGFKATRVLRDFYDDSPEDAYLMEFTIGREPYER